MTRVVRPVHRKWKITTINIMYHECDTELHLPEEMVFLRIPVTLLSKTDGCQQISKADFQDIEIFSHVSDSYLTLISLQQRTSTLFKPNS